MIVNSGLPITEVNEDANVDTNANAYSDYDAGCIA